jgi:hypothetical protein
VRRWGSGLTLTFHALAFLFVPAWLVMQTVLARWAGGKDRTRARPYFWIAGLIATLALWWWSLDASQQTLAQLEQAVSRQEWDRALTVARRVRAWPAAARLELTRALFHAGRLPEDLFTFPQTRGLDLLPSYDAGLAMARAEAQTLLELGQVNLAEHMAHESLELAGARPETLRLLAQINILKELPGAARVFLNRLRLTPFRHAEAERQLQLLGADPGGANQPEISAIRTRLPRTDDPDAGLPTERLLRQLLSANPTNRMAFDYLLAHQLLNSHLDELPADLGRLDAFGDPVLPRPCEEAILLYRARAPAKPVDLRGRKIRPATIERYRRFSDLIQRYQGQPATARAVLAPEFGDTFWFYALFGETGPVSAAATRSPKP